MAEASASLQLSVGDRVVYPNQGVCKVTAVDMKEVAGQKLTFVTLLREEDGAVVLVPEAKVRAIGVRKVASNKEVAEVFSFLKSDSDKANLDWKQRARTNVERMAQGGILGLAEVVKGLQVLSELRPLPNKERELYDSARHLLVYEMAAALSLAECNAEDAIDLVLFPPGRERPKRTAEEFRPVREDDEEGLGLEEGDMLGLESELEMPLEEEGGDEESGNEESGDEEAEAEPAAPAKRGRPTKAKAEATPVAAPKKEAPPPKASPPPKAAPAKAAPAKAAPVKGTAKKLAPPSKNNAKSKPLAKLLAKPGVKLKKPAAKPVAKSAAKSKAPPPKAKAAAKPSPKSKAPPPKTKAAAKKKR